MSKRKLALIITGLLLVGLAVVRSASSPEVDRYSADLLQKVLASEGRLERMEIMENSDWTEVCLVYPYENNSRNRPKEFWELTMDFRFEPIWWSIEEDEVGLVFLNRANKTGKVAKFPRSVVDRIEGGRCLPRDTAQLRLETLRGVNRTYQTLRLQ